MGELITRAILDAQGYSQRRIVRELGDDAAPLRRITHDAYTRERVGTPWDEYRLLARAVAIRGSWVLSHQSAAAVHRMAFYGHSLQRIHTTVDAPGGGGISGIVHTGRVWPSSIRHATAPASPELIRRRRSPSTNSWLLRRC